MKVYCLFDHWELGAAVRAEADAVGARWGSFAPGVDCAVFADGEFIWTVTLTVETSKRLRAVRPRQQRRLLSELFWAVKAECEGLAGMVAGSAETVH